MHCQFCKRDAVDRCYNCGVLFCAEHGDGNCRQCATGIVAGDSRADRVSAELMAPPARPAWWRPQPAEDYEPPACITCGGLARFQCPQCGDRCCREHAGREGLCPRCEDGRRGGNVFLMVMGLVLASLVALALLA
jgi:hypothetical protein